MSSSVVQICNLALSHLGDTADVTAIDPPDGSPQAAACARFYPVVRDAVLQAFPWSFAVKRAVLSELVNPSEFDWRYAYAIPSTCLRPLSALYPGVAAAEFANGETDAGGFPFVLETAQDGTRVMYTNTPTAVLRYIDAITDTAAFPPLVVLAMARMLASYLAGPILKGDTGIKVSAGHMELFKGEMATACATDARIGRHDTSNYRAAWIRARSYPLLAGHGDYWRTA